MICKKCRFYRRRGFIGRMLDFCTAPSKPDWDWSRYTNAEMEDWEKMLNKRGYVPTISVLQCAHMCRHYEKSIIHVIIDSVSKILGVK